MRSLFTIFENSVDFVYELALTFKKLFPFFKNGNVISDTLLSLTCSTIASISDNYFYYLLIDQLCSVIVNQEELDTKILLQSLALLGVLTTGTRILYSVSNYKALAVKEQVQNDILLVLQNKILKSDNARLEDLQKLARARVNLDKGLQILIYKNLSVTVPNIINIITVYQMLSGGFDSVSFLFIAINVGCVYMNTAYTNREICDAQQEIRVSSQMVRELFEENVNKYMTINYYNGFSEERGIMKDSLKMSKDNILKNQKARIKQSCTNNIIYGINFILLAYLRFSNNSKEIFTKGSVVKTLTYFYRLNGSIDRLINTSTSQITSLYDLKQCDFIFKRKREVTNDVNEEYLKSLKWQVDFVNVSYEIDGSVILSDISFSIRHGDRMGIEGNSGTGKSTIIKLLGGLLEPTSGKIIFSAYNDHGEKIIFENKRIRRLIVTVIPQAIEIFSRSLEKNVIYGGERSHGLIDIDSVMHSTLFANLRPDSFVTQSSLSGGQKKAIGITRALARLEATPCPIVIFDEAFTNLDDSSKALLKDSIEKIKQTSTCVMVSHSANELTDCNKRIALERGFFNEKVPT